MIKKSYKMQKVRYDIRGVLAQKAREIESHGNKVIKLNIGNPGAFNFEGPSQIIEKIQEGLPQSVGYSDSNGLEFAKKAILEHHKRRGDQQVSLEGIFIGNGVSELIAMSLQALLNPGDEILIPSPDYPLWTASVVLNQGQPVHYLCDENNQWNPDLSDIEKKITEKTKGIVLINPNNPTGAVYDRSILLGFLEIARKHNLVVFSDEIYEKILFDGREHIPSASLSEDIPIITFGGLSKNHRLAGFRMGWISLSGPWEEKGADYLEGLQTLSSLRLCPNVPMQYGIPEALKDETLTPLLQKNGRLFEQRNLAHRILESIPGVSCVKPEGSLYLFPKIDTHKYKIENDREFLLDFLIKEHVLLVPGTGFNWKEMDHFRVVFLAQESILEDALTRLERYLRSRAS